MLKRLNKALPELELGIFLWGILLQLLGVWFFEDKIRYSSGIWIGTILAAFMAYHMAVVIEDAIALAADHRGSAKIAIKSVIRYLVVAAVFFIMMYFHLGSLVPAFLGVMGLKIAAYAQPFMHKAILKLQGREEEPLEKKKEEIKDSETEYKEVEE